MSVRRAFSAALALDTRTKGLRLVFKSAGQTGLDLLLDKSDLLIHKKWLDFHSSHEKAACWLSRLASTSEVNVEKFSCDHIVTDLYDLVLTELGKGQTIEPDGLTETEGSLRLRVSGSLRHMLRIVEIAPGERLGEIEVSWTDQESDMAYKMHDLNLKCRITLHRESTCSNKKLDLLGPEGEQDEWFASKYRNYTDWMLIKIRILPSVNIDYQSLIPSLGLTKAWPVVVVLSK